MRAGGGGCGTLDGTLDCHDGLELAWACAFGQAPGLGGCRGEPRWRQEHQPTRRC
jgi:hypothetical protein